METELVNLLCKLLTENRGALDNRITRLGELLDRARAIQIAEVQYELPFA